MSKNVDQRVVEMQFDNGQFEKNVQTSLSTLDKLKEALGFKDASKGFDEITSASKNVDMSSLGQTVETIRVKFSALDTMAMTVLSNITNSAINLGKQLINTFAIEPIGTGFDEYELKMGSVQTIMAATGESLDTVNKYLQELNVYSDKTIYSFSDMTSNIGKFTNAGVKLEDAVMAIKGISNEAAVSGANANEASRAMYNFAQALSAGYVKLIDWKSIENANMATVEFKEQLLESAVAAGTLEKTSDGMYKVLSKNANGASMKETIDATHNFNDSLSYQWMTTDALVGTLKDYADETTDIGKKAYASAQDVKTFSMMMDTLKEAAQSGWAESWENIVGDFEEAKSFWTDMSNIFGDMIQDSSDKRNALLSGGLSSGWKQLLDQGVSDADAYKNAIIEAGKAQGVAVDEIIESTGSFADSLKEGWATADILGDALTNLTDKTRGLSDEEIEALGYTREQIDSLESFEASVKDGSVSLEDFADKMTKLSGRENIIESIKNTLTGLSSVLKPVKEGFEEIFPALTGEQLYGFTEKLASLTEKFKMSDETAQNLKSTFKGLFAVLDIVKQAVFALAKCISTALGYVLPFITNILGVTAAVGEFAVGIDNTVEKMGIFNGIAETLSDIFGGITKFVGSAAKGISEFFKALKSGESEDTSGFFNSILNVGAEIGKVIGTLKDKISEAVKNLNFDNIFNMFSAGVLFVFIKKIKDFIDKLSGTLDEINIFDSVKSTLSGVGDALKSWQENLKADTLIKLAEAVAILAASLFVIATIDEEKMGSSIAAITGLFADLVASMALLEKFTGKSSSNSGGGILSGLIGSFTGGGSDSSKKMLVMAGAILVLAAALKVISGIDQNKLQGAFLAITGLMVNMTAFMKVMESDGSKSVKGATQMLIFAAAIKVLASVCNDLAALSWEELARGLTGVGILLAEVSAFLNLGDFGNSSVTAGAGIVILAAALKILASACKDFAEMSWEELARGLTAVGALLVEIGAFTKITSDSEKMLSSGAALIEIAAAMKIMASALGDMGSMSWEEIAKGLTAMGGALIEVAAAVYLMPDNILSVGAGLLVASAALVVLGSALNSMGSMSWEEIAKGLITMGSALAMLAIGLNVMTGTLAGSAAMVVAAAALALLTPSLLLLGNMSWGSIAKGLITLAAALTIMGVAGYALTPVAPVILAISAALGILSVSIAVLGVGVAAIGVGLIALAVGLMSIMALGPALVNFIIDMIVSISLGVAQWANAIGEMIKAVILMAVDVIVECVPEIVTGALTLITQVLTALAEYIPQIVSVLCDFLINLFNVLAEKIPALAGPIGNVLSAIISVITSLIGNIDVGDILGLIAGIGMITALMLALSALSALAGPAMIGVLALGVLITELAVVLAALGALYQISGLDSLIADGGNFLETIGTALGQFVGGLIGGIASGITGQLPEMANDLSLFMTNLQPFVDGAKMIDSSAMEGVKALAEAVLILTASEFVKGIANWFTGGTSLADFGEQLSDFAPSFADFADTVAGTDFSNVAVSAEALKNFCDAASTIPNQGGLVSLFSGDNNLCEFADGLAAFGINWAAYARLVQGVDFSGVGPSAEALKSFSEAAEQIPESGGLAGLFNGDNDLKTFGDGLQSFGGSLKQYAIDVAGIDVDFVSNMQNAADVLKVFSETANSDKNNGSLKSFGKNLESFGVSFGTFCNSVNNADFNSTNVSSAASALSSIVDSAVTATQSKLETFTSIGKSITENLKKGINSKKSSVVTAVSNITKEMTAKIRGYYESFKSAGIYLCQGLAAGITAGKSNAVTEAVNMAKETLQAAKDEFDINSPSEVFKNEVGAQLGAGLALGIAASTDEAVSAAENMSDEVIEAAKTKFSNYKSWLEDLEFYGNLTTEEKLFAYEEAAEHFKDIPEIVKECNKEIYTLQNDLAEETYQAHLDYVEKEKAFNRMSEAEEIAYLQNVYDTEKLTEEDRAELEEDLFTKRQEYIEGNADLIKEEIARQNALLETYEKGSEEYANTLIYLSQLNEDYAEAVKKANEELAEAEYDRATGAFSDEQDYGGMSGYLEQLEFYKQLLPTVVGNEEKQKSVLKQIYDLEKKIYDAAKEYEEEIANVQAEAAEERKELTEQYYSDMTDIEEDYEEKREELEQEYADKVEEINSQLEDDIADLEQTYEDSLESRADALYDAYGLFDEVSEKDDVDGSDLMQNLQDQIDEFKEWQEALNELSAKGLDEALIEEFQDMGVSAVAELKALNNMSDSELQQYAALWAEKHQLATDQATAELEDLRTETQTQIAALKTEAAEELDEYVETWQAEMDELNQDMIDELDELRSEFKSNLKSLNSNTKTQLQTLKTEFDEKMGLIASDTEAEMQEMVDTVEQIISDSGWYSMGQQIVNGLIQGVSSRTSAFSNALSSLVNIGVEAVQEASEMHSPSKVFARLGEYMVLGLVKGIDEYAGKASEASSDMTENAINIVTDSLSKIYEIVDNNIESEPVISPVLDLSNISDGVYAIEDLLNPIQSINLGSSISLSNQNEYSEAEDLIEKLQKAADVSNENVISAIDGLKSEFSYLLSKMEQLKVVMDTGALVGAIAPDMDGALGRRSKLNKRGVI